MLHSEAAPESAPVPSLREKSAALLHAARSLPPYLGLAALFPGGPVKLTSLPNLMRESYAFHASLLARPGYVAMLRRLVGDHVHDGVGHHAVL